jgi:hypothetical protein
MRPLEGKAREVVIKFSLSPEVLQMTFAASGKLTVMIIVFDMACRTLLARTAQHATGAMTGFAIGKQMNAHQLHIPMKISTVHRFPTIFRVTV